MIITECLLLLGVWVFIQAPNWFASELQFLRPSAYWWSLLLLPFLAGTIWHWHQKRMLADQFGAFNRTQVLSIQFRFLSTFSFYLLLRLTAFFIIIALAQPVIGSKKVKGTKRMMDVVICLDVSNSMNVKDMSAQTTRLTAAKNAIGALVNQLKGERISVIIFANDAYVQLPLTLDIGAAKLFVPDIETSMISDQGTNIGRALEVAQTQFKEEDANRGIVIITDGEDHEKKWQEQVAKMKAKKAVFAYLGLGTSEGGLIPENPDYPEDGFKRENGTPVISRIEKQGIERMARETGGVVTFSENAFPDILPLLKTLQRSKLKTVKSVEFKVSKNYFYVPVLFALMCFVGYLFIPILLKWRNRN